MFKQLFSRSRRSVAKASRRSGSRPWLEALECREVPASLPTAVEQVFLERLNDARANPAAYGQTIGLDLGSVAPSQPLAFDTRLIEAARGHSQDMNLRNYFGHTGSDGSSPGARMQAAGYPTRGWAESITAGYATPEEALQALIIDAGVPDLGHRVHLLAMNDAMRAHDNVGIGIVQNGSGGYHNYYTIDTTYDSDTRPYLTGVAYNDVNNNARYDAGEGLGGVTIAVGGVGSVATWASGGYSFQVSPGTYTVTASGPGLAIPVTRTVTVSGGNFRLNFNPSPVPPGPRAQVLNGAAAVEDTTGTVDFGTTPAGVPVSRTLTIRNIGDQTLTLGAPSVPPGFTRVSAFGATSLAPGASTTFTVRFDAGAAGTTSGQVSFGTNDINQNPFNFTVTGTVGNGVVQDNRDDPQTRFVKAAYVTILGRSADAGGLAYWTAALNGGLSREDLVREFRNSLEFRMLMVLNEYLILLGREPDAAGLSYFAGRLGSGGTLEQVRAEVMSSDEFLARGADDGTFLTRLYQHGLGRAIDTAGAAYHEAQLAGGAPRGAVAAAVLGGQEGREYWVRHLYGRILHREPDAGGLRYWADRLAQGAPRKLLWQEFTGSREFLNF